MSWPSAQDHYIELIQKRRNDPASVTPAEWCQVANELADERRGHPIAGRIHQEEGYERNIRHARALAAPRPDGHLDTCAQQRCCSSECQFFGTKANWKPWQWQ